MITHAPLRPASVPAAVVLRRCACGGKAPPGGECEGCRRKRLQRSPSSAAAPALAPPLVHDVLRSPGVPLDPATRGYMEPRFGHSFADVRVHADGRAAESAAAVSAHAYTVGRDVVFGAGAYSPSTTAGRRLIAHELAHVVQQRGNSGATPMASLEVGAVDAPEERQAEAAAERVSGGGEVMAAEGRSAADGFGSPRLRRLVDGTSGVTPAQLARFREMVAEYRKLAASGALSPAEIAEVTMAILNAETKIAEAQRTASAGSSLQSAAGGALLITGGLVVDDATVIGVADDIAIPFVLLAAGILGLAAWARSSSPADIRRTGDAARDAVADVIGKIGMILMAQKVGDQVRGMTTQIAIHLARILGTTVSGKPPDHQNDPKKDRPHWWKEIKNWLRDIQEKGLSPKQLLRELRKKFSDAELAEIREALRKAAEMMGEGPPNFPPAF